MGIVDIVLGVIVAAIVGGLVGRNRDLHGSPRPCAGRAAPGAACGTASWGGVVGGVVLAFLLILFGGRLDDVSERWRRNGSGGPDE